MAFLKQYSTCINYGVSGAEYTKYVFTNICDFKIYLKIKQEIASTIKHLGIYILLSPNTKSKSQTRIISNHTQTTFHTHKCFQTLFLPLPRSFVLGPSRISTVLIGPTTARALPQTAFRFERNTKEGIRAATHILFGTTKLTALTCAVYK